MLSLINQGLPMFHSNITQLTRFKTVSAAPQDVLLPAPTAQVLVPSITPNFSTPPLAADQPLPLHARVGIGDQQRPLPRPLIPGPL